MARPLQTVIAAAALALSLGAAGLRAETPRDPCVHREGKSGTWHKNTAGKWKRCKPGAEAEQGGRGIPLALIVGGLAAVAGLGVGLGSSGGPASP